MDLNAFTKILDIIIWPTVVGGALLLFRKPLSTFVAGLGQRVTKFSAFDISIELAALQEPPTRWIDADVGKIAELRGGEVFSTTLKELFDEIKKGKQWDYLIVDVKDSHFWFVSRLFIFSVFLQFMCNLKCVVFVQSSGKYRRRLLGVASSGNLRISLGKAFPWMERALENMLKKHPIILGACLPSETAGKMIHTFIEDSEMRLRSDPEIAKTEGNSPPPNPQSNVKPDEWVRLGELNIWEHTHWLNLDIGQVSEAVTGSFFEHDSSHYARSPEVSGEKRTRALLHCKAPYVAEVNSKNEFIALIDRQSLAAMVGDAVAMQ